MLVLPTERLAGLGLELPDPPGTEGTWMPIRRVGALLYTGGVLPVDAGRVAYRGTVGADLSVAEAREAARLCALNVLALVEANGGLAEVAQVMQVTGLVRAATGYGQHVQVVNAASDLFVEVLGERGRHTRIALVTGDLPRGAPVELAAIVRMR